jgi:hypothetical protein
MLLCVLFGLQLQTKKSHEARRRRINDGQTHILSALHWHIILLSLGDLFATTPSKITEEKLSSQQLRLQNTAFIIISISSLFQPAQGASTHYTQKYTMPRNQGTSRKGKPKKEMRSAGFGKALQR